MYGFPAMSDAETATEPSRHSGGEVMAASAPVAIITEFGNRRNLPNSEIAKLKPQLQRLVHMMLSKPAKTDITHDIALRTDVMVKQLVPQSRAHVNEAASNSNSTYQSPLSDTLSVAASTLKVSRASAPAQLGPLTADASQPAGTGELYAATTMTTTSVVSLGHPGSVTAAQEFPMPRPALTVETQQLLSPMTIEKHVLPGLANLSPTQNSIVAAYPAHFAATPVVIEASDVVGSSSSQTLQQEGVRTRDLPVCKPTGAGLASLSPGATLPETHLIQCKTSNSSSLDQESHHVTLKHCVNVPRSVSEPGGGETNVSRNSPAQRLGTVVERLVHSTSNRSIEEDGGVLDDPSVCDLALVLPTRLGERPMKQAEQVPSDLESSVSYSSSTSRAIVLEPEPLQNPEAKDKSAHSTNLVSSSSPIVNEPEISFGQNVAAGALASHYHDLHVRMNEKFGQHTTESRKSSSNPDSIQLTTYIDDPVQAADVVVNTVSRFAQAGEFAAAAAAELLHCIDSQRSIASSAGDCSTTAPLIGLRSDCSPPLDGEDGEYVEIATPAVQALMNPQSNSMAKEVTRIKIPKQPNHGEDEERITTLQSRVEARHPPSLPEDTILQAKAVGVTSGAFLARQGGLKSGSPGDAWIVKPSSLEGAADAASLYNDEELKLIGLQAGQDLALRRNSNNLLLTHQPTDGSGTEHPTNAQRESGHTQDPHTNDMKDIGHQRVAVKRGVEYGMAAEREVAAYLLDHEGFAGVPPTYLYVAASEVATSTTLAPGQLPESKMSVSLKVGVGSDAVTLAEIAASRVREAVQKPFVETVSTTGSPEVLSNMGGGLQTQLVEQTTKRQSTMTLTKGSIQRYVDNIGSAEDMFVGGMPIDKDEVHKIGILDIRLLNLDRHAGNILITKSEESGKMKLVPIDHSYILPSIRDMADVRFDWVYYQQAKQPFSQKSLQYIARLDPIADAMQLRWLGFSNEAALSCLVSTLLLQRAAAAGLCLAEIGNLVQRIDFDEPSSLEKIVGAAFSRVQMKDTQNISHEQVNSVNITEIDGTPPHAAVPSPHHSSRCDSSVELPPTLSHSSPRHEPENGSTTSFEEDGHQTLMPPPLQRSVSASQRINDLYTRVATMHIKSVDEPGSETPIIMEPSRALVSIDSPSSAFSQTETFPHPRQPPLSAVDESDLRAAEEWLSEFLMHAIEEMDATIESVLQSREV